MRALTLILEEARALQRRDGIAPRDALATAITNVRRKSRTVEESREDGPPETLKIQQLAAASLNALLPRDREPTIEEIREAWKTCTEQSGMYGGAEHFADSADSPMPPAMEKR